ncbi:MAG: hypothetical protein ACR2NU_02715 [Aeoliella sp.]
MLVLLPGLPERGTSRRHFGFAKEIRLTLVLQIVLAVALLLALVTVVMSTKIWHWSQVVLVLFIILFGVGALFLGAEVFRIHRNLRAGIPKLEENLEAANLKTEELLKGTNDEPGIRELEHRLQIVSRERGRAWRGVQPASEVSDQGAVQVSIPNPQPHGLGQDTIVYAFESGEPTEGAQYLGEFRVIEANAEGVTLEPILLIDQRTGERLAASEGPWSLYETMPVDRHSLYADLSEEQLQQMLPEESVEEYLRHGTEATRDDDEWHVIGLDENDERVGPEQMDQAVKRLYDRPLRDYAYLFEEYAREKVVAMAAREAITEDNAKLETALESAKQLSQFREAEIVALTSDEAGMKQDRAAIEKHRDLVQRQLSNARQLIEVLLADNTARARELAERQLGLMQMIDSVAPAPIGLDTFSP